MSRGSGVPVRPRAGSPPVHATLSPRLTRGTLELHTGFRRIQSEGVWTINDVLCSQVIHNPSPRYSLIPNTPCPSCFPLPQTPRRSTSPDTSPLELPSSKYPAPWLFRYLQRISSMLMDARNKR
ncbi:hypothetical protein E2C01_052087 [Portunus trituberculatus]|uniref:Uncharacterized protein n=1 Tax=Portunus trituberculatus TaxID=210409 RepID=A0A5B7GGM7_PORTR|nr:hypothetical protein [Portunus trituberculatus]